MMLLESFDGSDAEFARLMDTDPSYLSQIKNATRATFGDDFAVSAERAAGMPEGWLDQWLPDEGGTLLDEKRFSPEDIDFMHRFVALPHDIRESLVKLVEHMVQSSKSKTNAA